MRIEVISNTPIERPAFFAEVEQHHVFRFNNHLYLKLTYHMGNNALNLVTDRLEFVMDNTVVQI